MSQTRHVMYASSSYIQQIFYERYGGLSEVELGKTEEVSSSLKGKLTALVGSLSGDISGSIGKDEIHRINFEKEMFKTKTVINELLEDDDIPSVTELYESDGDWDDLYKFSREVMLQPQESAFDDDKRYIKVTGIEDNIKFYGSTSLDKWSSRSNIRQALTSEDPYPFEGVLTPVKQEFSGIEQEEYSVNFLFICAPDKESLKRWRERQLLKRDH